MAIPHSKKPSGNKTEARVYDLLMNGLDEQWHLWHEPEIHRKEDEDRPYRPDFILLHENHGMFVLEVKGWVIEQIKGIKTEKLAKKGKGSAPITKVIYDFHHDGEKSVDTPFDQLAKYKRLITKKLQEHNSLLGLSKKKVSKLFDGAVAFVNIGSENLENEYAEENPEIAERILQHRDHRAFYKYQIDTWQVQPDKVEKELSRTNKKLTLSQKKLDTIRGIFHPESCLPDTPRSIITIEHILYSKDDSDDHDQPTTSPTEEMRVLSLAQEDVARYEIGSGHRTLFGVAGSGKTMILIARARWLARRHPKHKILVLCFNRPLSLYIAKVLEEYNNIIVMTFHAWVREKIGFEIDFDDSEYDSKLLDHLKERDVEKFHAILIDECQDWHSDWFKAILFAADDPVNGDLLIVGDGSQSTYNISVGFDWKDCGINPQPWRRINNKKTITFERNYRNTPQVTALAVAFAHTGRWGGNHSGKGILSLLPDPNECSRSNGSKPTLGQFSERMREMEFVAERINALLNTYRNLELCDFSIVYPGHFSPDKAREQFGMLFEKLDKKLVLYDFVKGGKNRNHERLLEGNTVKILNVSLMKGLEQKVCFVIGLEEYWDSQKELLYVAMTRATDWLYLTWSGEVSEKAIINDLKSDSSLYNWHTEIQSQLYHIDAILSCLNTRKIRCTYSAVAEYLKIEPKEVGQILGERRPEASWIVGRRTGLPTGYSNTQRHPGLYQSDKILNDGNELESLLMEWRAEQEQEQEK